MKKIFVLLCLFLPLLVSAQENAILNALNRYDYQLAIQLINKEKQNPELDILKAKYYKNLLKYNAATTILENVVRSDSLNIQALSELADCYQSAGNYKSAKLIYSNCLRLKYYNMFLSTFPKEPEKNKEEFLNELSGTYYSAVKHRIEELKTESFFRKE